MTPIYYHSTPFQPSNPFLLPLHPLTLSIYYHRHPHPPAGIKAVPKFWQKLNQNPVAVEASIGLRDLYPLTPIVPPLPPALRAQVTTPLRLDKLYITPLLLPPAMRAQVTTPLRLDKLYITHLLLAHVLVAPLVRKAMYYPSFLLALTLVSRKLTPLAR